MKKRLFALLLAAAITLALAACGGKAEETRDEDTVTEEQTEEDGKAAVDTDEPEEEADEEPSQPENLPADPAEEGEVSSQPANPAEKPVSQPVQKPETNVPAEKPAEEPQSKPAAKVDLTAFYESVTSGGNMPAMMSVEGEVLDAYYPGLSDLKTNQCGVYTAVISAAVGELALVEVENAADVQAVKDIFQARIHYQVGDDQNPGGAWYPASIEGWKNGSRVVSNGNYVMLIALSEGADDVVNSFNALFA